MSSHYDTASSTAEQQAEPYDHLIDLSPPRRHGAMVTDDRPEVTDDSGSAQQLLLPLTSSSHLVHSQRIDGVCYSGFTGWHGIVSFVFLYHLWPDNIVTAFLPLFKLVFLLELW